jgi:hypothetical protein
MEVVLKVVKGGKGVEQHTAATTTTTIIIIIIIIIITAPLGYCIYSYTYLDTYSVIFLSHKVKSQTFSSFLQAEMRIELLKLITKKE